MQTSIVSAGGQRFQLTADRGKVVEAKKWVTAHVGGGQGDTGVTTRHIEHDQFVVSRSDGTQAIYRAQDLKLALVPGHDVSVVVVANERGGESRLAGVRNHTLGNFKEDLNSIREVFGTQAPANQNSLLFAQFLLMVAAFVGIFVALYLIAFTREPKVPWLLAGAACGAVFVALWKRGKALDGRIESLRRAVAAASRP